MEITDFTKKFNIPESAKHVAHAPIFPKNILCVIAGSTGCGKTNLMLNFLMKEEILNYSHVYVYSSTLHQPAYEYLKEYYKNLETFIRDTTNKIVKIANFFDADTEIQNPSELDKNKSHIMIFDDVMLEDQTVIKDYFCRGRHNNVNVFYLCQSYYKVAKHCIRDNANIFILFRQDNKTLKSFYETHISGDMDFKEFKQFCDRAWNARDLTGGKGHGFVVINIWDDVYFGRYWQNCNVVYIPQKYRK